MAADTFQFKRGTTAAVAAYLPAVGEPVYDITLKRFSIGDGVTLGGVVPSNVATADKLTTARNIALTGTVTGTVAFDGSANVAIATSVGASLQASLDVKAPLASPALTGVPTVPTAAPLTNTTQAASTAFVDAARVVLVAVDALKAPLASPALTGVPTVPTAAIGTNTTQIATMAAIQARLLGTVSQSGGVPTGTIFETGGTLATGKWTKYANGDMVWHRRLSTTTTISTGVGSLFYSGVIAATAFGISFVGDVPTVQITSEDSLGTTWSSASSPPTLTNAPAFYLFAPTSTVSRTYIVNLTAYGKWF